MSIIASPATEARAFLREFTLGDKHCAATDAFLWLKAALPSWVTTAHHVITGMFSSSQKPKILKSIVSFIVVDVMNDFVYGKRSTKIGAHNHSVLRYVSWSTVFERIGMFWRKNVDITVSGYKSSALPAVIQLSFLGMAGKKAVPSGILFHSKASSSARIRYIFPTSTFTQHDCLLPSGITGIVRNCRLIVKDVRHVI